MATIIENGLDMYLKEAAGEESCDEKMLALLKLYEKNRLPVNVSFRKLVNDVKGGERYTHYIHQYPAKLLPQIPLFFIRNSAFCKPEGSILDPFSGSGTVALETVLSNRAAMICDSNPLARLIAKVKITPIDPDELIKTLRVLKIRILKAKKEYGVPSVVNINYWFGKIVIQGLAKIKAHVDELKGDERDFFLVCFSSLVREVACTDKRLSVPVKDKDLAKYNNITEEKVFASFEKIVAGNIKRMESFWNVTQNTRWALVSTDARKLISKGDLRAGRLNKESVDAIITSPPYAGAQKYVRASSLSLGWLGMADEKGLRPIEKKTVGREHLIQSDRESGIEVGIPEADKIIKKVAKINKERAFIAATYLNEMKDALTESALSLKRGGSFLLVVGDNTVCGEKFKTSDYLRKICLSIGLEIRLETVDKIQSRGLMTKRNKTAGIIAKEHVIWMTKK